MDPSRFGGAGQRVLLHRGRSRLRQYLAQMRETIKLTGRLEPED